MRRALSLVLIASIAVLGLSAQVKGPIVDKILVNAKTQEDIALKDVATGKTDVFNWSTGGPSFKALPDDVKAAIDPYDNTGSSYISLWFNSYPNKAPYTGVVEGKTQFNPFAVREIRFAMNFLINRKQIVDEILVGAGVPMYTPVTPGQPNSSKFGLVASKLGITATGNEKKALADIDAAMKMAAALPENKGKLVKGAQWWTFEGVPVTIKFLIRVDDPTVRLPEGRYVADQIEKAGIKVERLEWDRTKCGIRDKTNPADLAWHAYTEGWGGGQTYAFWDGNIAQMYAPWYSFMPGGNKGGFWNHQHEELDSLTQDCVNGRVQNTEEYYDKLLKAARLGLEDAVRVFVASQTVYYAANKDRFNVRMATGAGDGVNKFSFYTADVKPEKDGTKVLRSTQFSSRGALFMSSWDPIGPYGASDTYTQGVLQCLGDPEQIASPITGIPLPLTASWKGLKTDIVPGSDPMLGKIPVPKDAVLWNAVTQKWESGIVYVDLKGDGSEYGYAKASEKPEYRTAWTTATYTFKPNKWHHGRAITQADYRYALSRPYDLSINRGKDDKIYEEAYASSVNPNLPRAKGYVFNKDGSITVFGDANYPMDQASLAALLIPTLMIEASNYGTFIPWEIHEALKFMVAEGAASGEVYVFNDNGDFTEVDLIGEKCVKDVLAKLKELAAKQYVPPQLVGFVTPTLAAKGYNDAIAFIEKHGHAWISNGGFILDQYDPANNTATLVANRDPMYPFEKGYFTKLLTTSFARVDAVKVPAYKKGAGMTVGITVADVAYPANTAKPAEKANVKVTLIGDKEISYKAKFLKAGAFEAAIPAKDLDSLKPGAYTLVVEAAFGTESGAVETANIIVF